jgi:hypothetical protein
MNGDGIMQTLRITAVMALLMLAAVAVQAEEHTFVLDASIPCCSSGEHLFGWLNASSGGMDPADVPEPPTPPSDHLVAAFRMPGVDEPELWRRDLRATADFLDDGRESWELSISTNEAPGTCTVTIAPVVGATTGLQVIFSGAYSDTTTFPVNISFPLAGEAQLFIEVVAEAVASESMTWGDFKSLFE